MKGGRLVNSSFKMANTSISKKLKLSDIKAINNRLQYQSINQGSVVISQSGASRAKLAQNNAFLVKENLLSDPEKKLTEHKDMDLVNAINKVESSATKSNTKRVKHNSMD
jgi:hypothetical protein